MILYVSLTSASVDAKTSNLLAIDISSNLLGVV